MKFYNRTEELEVLTTRLTSPKFELIYLLGRRRIGKTELIQHCNTEVLNIDFLYLYVEKMDLPTFLNRQERYFYEKLGIRYNFLGIDDLLEVFFNQDTINILVIDEFQNFASIDTSIFSTFQRLIDKYHNISSKKIVVLGSMQSMMVKIFEHAKEPLYKRATQPMKIKNFDIHTQIEILQDMFGKNYSYKILLDTYTIFGGIPYYLKSLWEQRYDHYDLETFLRDLFFKEFAIFQNEGREILIEEFGQKYRRFFAILEAIATGKTKRVEIVNELEIGEKGELDVYLRELNQVYEMIEVVSPILEPKSTVTRYKIKDTFLNFRFKYIYAKRELFSLGNYDIIVSQVLKSFSQYQGFAFENLVKEWLILQNQNNTLDFSIMKIGTWFDRKNHEIDIVYTDGKNRVVCLECKLNDKRINALEEQQLRENVQFFLNKHPQFTHIKVGFAVFDEQEIVKIQYIEM